MNNNSQNNNAAYKILIVDDVARNIQILGNILSSHGFQIAYAQSGQQALNIAKKQTFDLILLDIMMPEMDGYEVCESLKSDKKTSEVPVIFLTAKADMDSIVKGFETGGQDYITKPFNSAELLARVNTHILLREQKKQLKEMNSQLEKKVEERTYQLRKANVLLEKLDHTKSDFLSIISHELRTPLNGVIGLINLLDSTSIDESQQEYINHLKEVSERLVRFSDLALLITSLKINKYKPDFLPVSVNHLVESGIEEYRSLRENSTLKINFENHINKPLVFADAELIRQCCILIIENVVKFAGEELPLDISIITSDWRVSIQFVDRGAGFTDEAVDNLFELFGAGNILNVEGLGLSLAAVKLIMDVHNGMVEAVNNTETSGAIVRLHFDVFNV